MSPLSLSDIFRFLAVLKDRIRRKKERFGDQDSEHVVIDSLQEKKFYYSSSTRFVLGILMDISKNFYVLYMNYL